MLMSHTNGAFALRSILQKKKGRALKNGLRRGYSGASFEEFGMAALLFQYGGQRLPT